MLPYGMISNTESDRIHSDGPEMIVDEKSEIFCLPDCSRVSGRNKDNYFSSVAKTALEWGYMPCSSCRPMDGDESDENISALMTAIARDPDFSIKTRELLDRKIDPDKLRSHYQTRFNLSFQDYLRMRRLNHRFGVMGLDKTVLEESTDTVLRLNRIETPLGPMLVAASAKGIAMLEFAERRMLETQIRRLERYHHGELIPGNCPWFELIQDELREYFEGKLKSFSVPLDLRGTPFQTRVWALLKSIKWGETCSYGDQARMLGNVKAVRAVARANGDNPISIVIPCHRVLGADGSMTGYGGRIWRKVALLKLESEQGRLFD